MTNQLSHLFPLLTNQSNLIYLDSASTAQKPESVISAMSDFYRTQYATVHRGIYRLSEEATTLYENVRTQVAHFFGAPHNSEIVFTKGTTESINFIATAWGNAHIKKNDVILISVLEHHSNMVPWQELAKRTGAQLKLIPITAQGTLDLDAYEKLLTLNPKLVALVHTSNVIGTTLPVKEIIQKARARGARILIDGAQSAAHRAIDLADMQPDFFVCSGHKLCGPTGIGILYIRAAIQHEVPPYQFGGGMVDNVTAHSAQFKEAPYCYEAGTAPVAEVIGLGAALDFYKKYISFHHLQQHEASLTSMLIAGLQQFPAVRILGPIDELQKQGHLVTFVHDTIHAHDIGAYLDQHSIAVRAGNFCAQPLAHVFGIASAVRISFHIYNTAEEVSILLSTLEKLFA
jgi:cysteine desulfurase/selenocysteine lyase